MTRFFSALAALGITTSLVAVYAAGANAALPGPVRTISTTAEGKPILLKRLVVTATALPDTPRD
jgi:hypothetical protein